MHYLLIVLCLLLSACGGRSYQNSEYITSKFTQEKKAVVIFKIKGTSTFLGAAPKVMFDLVRIDKQIGMADGIIYHYAPGFFSALNVWDKSYICLMVEPGFYVIDNISWTQGNVNYYTPKGIIPTSSPVQYGAFEVKPGSVNYIGDLEVYCQQAKLGINCTDHFNQAKDSLEKEHPELASSLSHTEFLPAGYSTFSQR